MSSVSNQKKIYPVINNRKLFQIDDYLDKNKDKSTRNLRPAGPADKAIENNNAAANKKDQFYKLCSDVLEYFNREWDIDNGRNNEATDRLLYMQKRAIIGYEAEVSYFRAKINDYLKNNNISCWYPSWYDDLVSAIFHENWGFAGIQQWRGMKSPTAKIIGERIYFLENGKMKLQEQTISRDRLNQLINALLLKDPKLRINEGTAEVHTLDGIRIKIYTDIAIEPIVVFRNYIVDNLTFDEQVKRGTIPAEIVPMLIAMNRVGYNVMFIGPPGTGKTTFLETWQRYEDQSLEGIQVQTDPEIISSKLLPKAPVMDIIADGDRLRRLTKDLVRGDYDYIIMAETRDGVAAKISLKATSKGTRRFKGTFHSSDPVDFPYDFAEEIVSEYGGDMYTTIIKVAKGFHYLFELCKLKDKGQKRLKGIYEIRFDRTTFDVTVRQICKYDFVKDDWTYRYDIGSDKEMIAYEEDIEAFNIFRNELKKLSEAKPMQGESIFVPPYMKLRR